MIHQSAVLSVGCCGTSVRLVRSLRFFRCFCTPFSWWVGVGAVGGGVVGVGAVGGVVGVGGVAVGGVVGVGGVGVRFLFRVGGSGRVAVGLLGGG